MDDGRPTSLQRGDVVHEHERGSKVENGVGEGCPVTPARLPALKDVLARESGGEDVDRFGGVPVGGSDVAEVGDAGPAGGQDRSGVRVGLGVPDQSAAEHPPDGRVIPP